MQKSDARKFLEAQSAANDAKVVRCNENQLDVDVDVLRADGKIAHYQLSINASGVSPTVRERAPDRLPIYCPERHINGDGTFCLNWKEGDPLHVEDAESADSWWATLHQFLRLQERASQRRKWPSRMAWAHGDAAKHQQIVEHCVKALGERFSVAFQCGSFSVLRRHGPTCVFLILYDGKKRLYAVRESDRRVVTLGQPCVCGRKRVQLRACGDHAQVAASLIFALREMEIEEKKFWDSQTGKSCCGTMKDCPLASNAPQRVTAAKAA